MNQYPKIIKARVMLILVTMPILFLAGCTNRQTNETGGFDIVKFLQNPVVMIVLALFIVYWMMKRSK